jgi:hypothetical protein
LKVFEVERKVSAADAKLKAGEAVPYLEPNLMEEGLYIDGDTNEPIFYYAPMPRLVPELRRAVLNMKMGVTTRGTGMENASRVFGMTPRRSFRRRDYCAASTLSEEAPHDHDVLIQLAEVFAEMFIAVLPEQAVSDMAAIDEILSEWRMTDNSLWTSGVVNRSATLPYHTDGANFPTWSAMPVIRRNMRGGYLHLVEYDLVCSCRDGWVTFFYGNKYMHGVTPMHATTKDAYRYSIVYYALRGMKDCFTYAIEQSRGRTIRTAREENILAEAINITVTHDVE